MLGIIFDDLCSCTNSDTHTHTHTLFFSLREVVSIDFESEQILFKNSECALEYLLNHHY